MTRDPALAAPRPLIALGMKVPAIMPSLGRYDPDRQITIAWSGEPAALMGKGEKTFADTDPPEPKVIAARGTQTRADRDSDEPDDRAPLAATKTFTEADRDPADPVDPVLLANAGTSSKADSDPPDPVEPSWLASSGTATKAASDPGDPIQSTPPEGNVTNEGTWGDTVITGRVAV